MGGGQFDRRPYQSICRLVAILDQDHIESFISIAGTYLVRHTHFAAVGDANSLEGCGTSIRKDFLGHKKKLSVTQAKAMAAFLSGEMKDTVQVNPAGAYGMVYCAFVEEGLTVYPQVLERFFSRKERAKLFRSWVGSASMWVKVAPLRSPSDM